MSESYVKNCFIYTELSRLGELVEDGFDSVKFIRRRDAYRKGYFEGEDYRNFHALEKMNFGEPLSASALGETLEEDLQELKYVFNDQDIEVVNNLEEFVESYKLMSNMAMKLAEKSSNSELTDLLGTYGAFYKNVVKYLNSGESELLEEYLNNREYKDLASLVLADDFRAAALYVKDREDSGAIPKLSTVLLAIEYKRDGKEQKGSVIVTP